MPQRHRALLAQLIAWAESLPNIRTVLLTSSRANPYRTPDRFSDFDIELYALQPCELAEDTAWLAQFGTSLVTFEENDGAWFTVLVQYEDTTKMDFQIGPHTDLLRATAQPTLKKSLDIGCKVLVDKDGVAARLPEPTYSAFIVDRPGEDEYLRVVNEFWWDATYVAKHICRGDLIPAKYSLDHMMKHHHLRTMLQWRVAMDRGWTWSAGAHGKGLQEVLDRDTWQELAGTYVDGRMNAQWEGLFATCSLFRRVAVQVARELDYAYPKELDNRVTAYLKRVKSFAT